MSKVVLLDTSILGLVTHPRPNTGVTQWFQSILSQGYAICVPEIADYELRRELVRSGKMKSIDRLNSLNSLVEYLPISTEDMRLAADLWAQARNQGRPTADNQALDGDVILAAQAVHRARGETIVATSNVGHLDQFVVARTWQEIS